MELRFRGELWFWRGPSPFHFVTVSAQGSAELAAVSPAVSYGWGVLPVEAQVGGSTWRTSLFPKEGGYVLPVKAAIRRAEDLELGDVVDVRLAVDL